MASSRAELPVGPENGLERDSVVSLDKVMTIPVQDLGRHLGHLADHQEPALAEAIGLAFDLDWPAPI